MREDRRAKRLTRHGVLTAGIAFGLGAFGVMGVASATSHRNHTYTGCLSTSGKTIYNVAVDATKAPICTKPDTAISWNAVGPRGLTGKTGIIGKTGKTGPMGPRGLVGPKGDIGPGSNAFGTATNQAAAATTSVTCTLGQIILTAGSVAVGTPANGQLLPIASNAAIFSLLGTTYGGNGTTNFALPDLRSAAPNGMTYTICTLGVYPSRS